MSLSDYNGPANSPEILQYLVGERITAAFTDHRGKVILVLESGRGIDFFEIGGHGPGYGPLSPDAIGRLVAERRREVNRKLAELGSASEIERP